MADLYVYFYEQGLRLLRKGGRLSFVITNKWIRAGYAEKLREKLGRDAWMESVVDFGHAKGFFPDADVMPCVIVARRPDPAEEPPVETEIAVIPRDAVDMTRLPEQVRAATFSVPRTNLAKDAWVLEPPEVAALMQKIRRAGVPLKEYAGVSPMYGIKTGFNEAFVIDGATRERMIREDPRSEEIIKPYLRGQDIDRWSSDWAGQWMIVIASSANRRWPWSDEPRVDLAEAAFARTYPALHRHLQPHRTALAARQDQGRFPWELRECAYYKDFEKPKVIYNDITWNPQFSLDCSKALINNTGYFLPTSDAWLLAGMNAPIGWWFAWRGAQHAKDEALRYFNTFVESYPVPKASSNLGFASGSVDALSTIQQDRHHSQNSLRDWYRHSLDIEAIPNALRNPFALDADRFIAAIRKARGAKKGQLTAAAVRHVRDEHTSTVAPMARRLAEAMRHEQRLSDLVNQAYGLTEEDVALMWRTAPPRMPIPPPGVAPGEATPEQYAPKR